MSGEPDHVAYSSLIFVSKMDLKNQNIIVDSKIGPTINHDKMMNDQSIISFIKIDSLFVHSLFIHSL